ncbi:MaoC like domain protein [compost metagenome]
MSTEWIDLPTPPALPGLFARAAVRRGMRGRQLPGHGLRSQVRVDPQHLERYRQVCGFADDHLLPPTYPHILAFPLQMALLTEERFPFPLLGLVHLENRIRVVRPLGGLASAEVSVRVDDLQPHAKGVTFSILTQLHDPLGLLWEGDSRVLFRGLQIEGAAPSREEEDALPLALLDRWDAPEDIGRRYARVSGDYNPIHLSAASAKLFGFPQAIAHGLWNKARSLAALQPQLPRAGYLVEARFRKPVLLPTSLTLLASAPGPDGQFSLVGKEDLPHMAGNWRTLDA